MPLVQKFKVQCSTLGKRFSRSNRSIIKNGDFPILHYPITPVLQPCCLYPVCRSISFNDLSNSPSKSLTLNPTALAPSKVAIQIIIRLRVSRGGGSSG